jgi:Kdo2-lipid IVA lauroyltransferase/acyltransferase
LIRHLLLLLGMLPRDLLNLFSRMSGLIWYRLDKRHRRVALENILNAFPGRFGEAQARKQVKQIFYNIAAIPFEVIWFYGKPRQVLSASFCIKGLKHLERARQKYRGVLLLTGHMGNFELLVAAAPTVGLTNLYGVYRKFDYLPLEKLMLEMRQRFGMVMVPTGGAARKIDTLLSKGEIVGSLFDQNAGWYNGVVTEYFGRPACSKNSLAKIVLRTNAAVVPMFIKKKNQTYVVEFFPEIILKRTGCPIKDIEVNTQNYVSAVESMVRQCPEQYFWVHNRWKTRPCSPI